LDVVIAKDKCFDNLVSKYRETFISRSRHRKAVKIFSWAFQTMVYECLPAQDGLAILLKSASTVTSFGGLTCLLINAEEGRMHD